MRGTLVYPLRELVKKKGRGYEFTDGQNLEKRTQDIGTGHTLAGNYSLEAYGSSTENPEEIWILLEKE